MTRLLLPTLFLSSFCFANESFFNLSAESIDGKATPLSTYSGKVVLAVNTASECGFTSQYKDLEALYKKYQSKGLVVLGFPSNDFGGQEPGDNQSIKAFCEKKFKVTFPLFAKGSVTGDKKQPVYSFLTSHGPSKGEVGWNFEKFVINKKGAVVARFKSGVNPGAPEVDKLVQTLIAE
jgi:glutathione peroxidase